MDHDLPKPRWGLLALSLGALFILALAIHDAPARVAETVMAAQADREGW